MLSMSIEHPTTVHWIEFVWMNLSVGGGALDQLWATELCRNGYEARKLVQDTRHVRWKKQCNATVEACQGSGGQCSVRIR